MKTELSLAGILIFLCMNANAQSIVKDFHSNNKVAVIAVGIVLLLLVCYIIAWVKSKRVQMILTANNWDKTLLLIVPICLFVSWFWGFDHALNTIQTGLLIVAAASFVGTVLFSIIFNSQNIAGIILSISAKIFIILLTILLFLLVLIILILSIIISLMSKNNNNEYILLKYDKTLDAFVGYRYNA